MRHTLRFPPWHHASGGPSRTPERPVFVPRVLVSALITALIMMVAACGSDGPGQSLNSVKFTVDSVANDTAPVAIDIVFVRDRKLLEQAGSFTAVDWLAKREQLIKDNPDAIEVRSWELVPGQALTADVSDADDAYGILVFANYAAPGPHRLRIRADARDITLKIGANDVELLQP
ncbi:MAG: hypothetical protein P4M00_24425 [Azospirillaceae bacterium]|nr:hypothetical protein [Azospirillaceae bacterium]